MGDDDGIIGPSDLILVTGAGGFIGSRVVGWLLNKNYFNVRCLVRDTSKIQRLEGIIDKCGRKQHISIISGNLLSPEDCSKIAKDVTVIYHLAAGIGVKAFPDAYLNSVVTTRNLLDATLKYNSLRRFVNVSSFAVYTNRGKPRKKVLDENCPVEKDSGSRAEAYCFGKTKQDELVLEYGQKHNIPWIILRPGTVFGPGKGAIPGRVGIDTFGFFLHMGGSNLLPLTFVENCAEAIVMAGIKSGINGQVFNIVDDDLPSSRRFLRLYKRRLKRFRSIYLPHALSYLLCYVWEKYSGWSKGQLPPTFTRREWSAYWKKTNYTNYKLKEMVGWTPKVPMEEGLRRFFESLRE
jgi:nucleoside-diphosphate-sugar epimerase